MLTQDNEFFKWNKGDKEKLSNHFNTVEFSCRCKFEECKEQKITKNLVTKLELVRETSKYPLEVLSGYRCQKYQDYLGSLGKETATGISQHTLGNAADVNSKLLTILNLFPFINNYFDTYGVGLGFIHCDLRPKRPDGTKRTWSYKGSPIKF